MTEEGAVDVKKSYSGGNAEDARRGINYSRKVRRTEDGVPEYKGTRPRGQGERGKGKGERQTRDCLLFSSSDCCAGLDQPTNKLPLPIYAGGGV